MITTEYCQCYGGFKAGVHGLHVTVNGMGNALETHHQSTVAVINDFMPEIEISVKNLHCTPLVN
jgi:hypothetical protein